jgi:hypothetical protein
MQHFGRGAHVLFLIFLNYRGQPREVGGGFRPNAIGRALSPVADSFFERVYLYPRVQRKLRGGKVTSGGDGRDGDEAGR